MNAASAIATHDGAVTGASDAVEPVVRVTGLVKTYGGGRGGESVAAVDNVDVTVSPGEFLVLLGPSGCGKSTLLRSIAGLETPSAGRVEIGDRVVFDSAKGIDIPPERRKIGMVFQSYALWPHLTVAKNIGFPLKSKKVPQAQIEERVADILDLMSIKGLGHRYPSELSGGQQQRVSLARALVDNPPVVLFDEPLSSVDAAVRRDLRAELRSLKERSNFAGLYVTHDQDEAMELGDVVAVMGAGAILQLDTPQNLYERPASVNVGTLVGRMNLISGELVAGSGGVVARSSLGETPVEGEGRAAGTSGRLGVRPEDIVLSDHQITGGIAGTVERVLFFGAHTDVAVDVDGVRLTATLPSGPTRLAQGDPVWVDVAASRFHWLAH